MSRIVVLGAGGKAGRVVTAEAHERGHEVVAVVRDPGSKGGWPPGVAVIAGDATDPDSVRSVVRDADAVVIAVGGPGRALWRDAAEVVVEAIAEVPDPRPRIIHVGGGATLKGPDGAAFLESPQFPAAYLDAATGQAAALDYYRSLDDAVSWTYVSPPPIHFAPGARTGTYRIGHDEPVSDAAGHSALTYEDLAVVIVDEIERPSHRNTRITAGY